MPKEKLPQEETMSESDPNEKQAALSAELDQVDRELAELTRDRQKIYNSDGRYREEVSGETRTKIYNLENRQRELKRLLGHWSWGTTL